MDTKDKGCLYDHLPVLNTWYNNQLSDKNDSVLKQQQSARVCTISFSEIPVIHNMPVKKRSHHREDNGDGHPFFSSP